MKILILVFCCLSLVGCCQCSDRYLPFPHDIPKKCENFEDCIKEGDKFLESAIGAQTAIQTIDRAVIANAFYEKASLYKDK